MAWHYGTFACGHDGRVNIIGPMKHRVWKAERAFSRLCPSCYGQYKQDERERKSQEAAEEARKMGLPDLVGTQKQVEWATRIRQGAIEWYEKYIEKKFYLVEKITEEQAIEGMDYLLEHQTSAAWWIDNRDEFRWSLGKILLSAYEKMTKEQQKAEEMELDVDAVVRPEKPKTETIAEIRIVGTDTLQIRFPEFREDIRKLMRGSLSMTWDTDGKCWVRKVNYFSGSVEDRAAEAGHRLLAAGFVVKIRDQAIREKAISGQYEPEHTRWVAAFTSGEHEGKFGIFWNRMKEDFYDVARRLPQSRWSNPYVIVPPEHFEEVLDFAERYGFRISEAAQKLIDAAREAKDRALMVKVAASDEPERVVASTKPPVLEVPDEVDIDEELRDDD